QTVPARPARISAPPPITQGANRASAVSLAQLVEQAAAPAKPRRMRWIAAAVVLALAAGIGGIAMMRGKDKPAIALADGHNAIAVIDFENRDKRADAAWFSTALAEVIASDLGAGGKLQIVPAADVARTLAELKVGDISDWSASRLGDIRSRAGAEYVLAGSYRVIGSGELRVEAKLYATDSGKLVATAAESGLEADLGELGARLAKAIKRSLGVAVDEVAPAPPVLPADPTAAKLYAEGLAKLRRLDLIDARDLLSRANYAAPNDPLIHAALASVWRELGYETKARSESKQAFEASASLPDESKRAIEAQYRVSTGQWEEAIGAYKKLYEDFPGRLDYGLALASAQVHAGDVKSAYATLSLLRKLPPPAGFDPRIELAESEAAEVADDVERMREHAQKAALLARKRGAGLLLAKALFREGWALFTLGRYDEADARNTEAKQLFTDLGDRAGLARTLNNVALALHRKHRDSEAMTTFADALEIAQEVGDTQAQAWVLHNWGYLMADTGDLTKAVELIRKKLDLGVERGVTTSSLAAAHVNLSEILRWRGDLAGAQEHCNAAEDLLRGTDARRFAAYLALHCGEVLRAKDDLPGAIKRFTQAIGWASDVMQPAESAEMRIAMARAQLDSGDLDNAETLARGAITDLRAAKEGSQQVCAVAVLASTLLARNEVDQAATEIAATKSLPAEGVSFSCRLEAEAVAAHIMWRQDPTKLAEAVAALEDARKRAAAAAFVQLELQIRLLLGTTQGAAGRAALRTLVHDAGALDFKLVARKAKQAAK
ncbi:MAG TPA: tetratricopeptide repeat protein, partial [Kofleriaceae bacterium]